MDDDDVGAQHAGAAGDALERPVVELGVRGEERGFRSGERRLEGGDTLLWGVDFVATAILMKEGRPVARFTGPREAVAAKFIQAGHELFVAWIANENGGQMIHLDTAVRESLE